MPAAYVANARRQRAAAVLKGLLETKSAKPFTLRHHQEQVKMFRLWASYSRLPLLKGSQTDAAWDEHFEHLYFRKASLNKALWGRELHQ